MKSRSPLILSLGVNVVLAGIIVYLLQPRPPVANPESGAPVLEVASANPPMAHPDPDVGPKMKPATAPQLASFNWRSLQSADYPTYMANLRAVGCPEETIRDIIIADVNKSYAQRRSQLLGTSGQPYRYWATRDQTELPEQQQRALEIERRLLIRDLTGVEFDEARYVPEQDDVQQKLSFLDPGRCEQVRSILDQFAGLEEKIKEVADGDPQEDARAVYQQYVQRREQLRQLLTPEEFEQYDLNFSWTAQNVRDALQGFNPTEQEFRAIFKNWRAHDDYLANLYAHDQQAHQNDPGNESVKAAIKEALGDERYQEYQNAWWSSEYRHLAVLARDLGLPADTPSRVYQVKLTIETAQNELQANTAVSEEQRRELLRAQAEQMLVQTLGQAGYQAYFNNGPAWLKHLNR